MSVLQDDAAWSVLTLSLDRGSLTWLADCIIMGSSYATSRITLRVGAEKTSDWKAFFSRYLSLSLLLSLSFCLSFILSLSAPLKTTVPPSPAMCSLKEPLDFPQPHVSNFLCLIPSPCKCLSTPLLFLSFLSFVLSFFLLFTSLSAEGPVCASSLSLCVCPRSASESSELLCFWMHPLGVQPVR